MATAAIVSLVELVVAAINAASLAGSFSGPVVAVEDYSLALDFESTEKWQVAVQPGPSRSMPSTLDGAVKDELSVRLVIWRNVNPADIEGIKQALLFVQQVCDAAADVETDNLCYIGTSPELGPDGETKHAYDQNRLTQDGVFHSAHIVNFDAMR